MSEEKYAHSCPKVSIYRFCYCMTEPALSFIFILKLNYLCGKAVCARQVGRIWLLTLRSHWSSIFVPSQRQHTAESA